MKKVNLEETDKKENSKRIFDLLTSSTRSTESGVGMFEVDGDKFEGGVRGLLQGSQTTSSEEVGHRGTHECGSVDNGVATALN